jgi:hypothetical protein
VACYWKAFACLQRKDTEHDGAPLPWAVSPFSSSDHNIASSHGASSFDSTITLSRATLAHNPVAMTQSSSRRGHRYRVEEYDDDPPVTVRTTRRRRFSAVSERVFTITTVSRPSPSVREREPRAGPVSTSSSLNTWQPLNEWAIVPDIPGSTLQLLWDSVPTRDRAAFLGPKGDLSRSQVMSRAQIRQTKVDAWLSGMSRWITTSNDRADEDEDEVSDLRRFRPSVGGWYDPVSANAMVRQAEQRRMQASRAASAAFGSYAATSIPLRNWLNEMSELDQRYLVEESAPPVTRSYTIRRVYLG